MSIALSSAKKNGAAPVYLSAKTTCKKLLNEREDRYFCLKSGLLDGFLGLRWAHLIKKRQAGKGLAALSHCSHIGAR